ncbi:Kazal-type serine protease inhibitor domain-containing protein [Flavobacterium pallidum]|uniref:Kazal-like domain-containing protein n=1 Tax=Flavobacterium pallidum TaxID=2172098 RepID=A0A2S1SH40_9FLAO|nr:Kazal-type serine protease inhibitor domain-containing protein [Flavobacterium pallidum]AWI25695.1 hypothetical protein HYN49_07160 [Flavobacterium pallidum]
MKKIKLLFLFLSVAALALTSCADESPVNNPVNTDASISLRTTLKQIKKTIGTAGRDGSGDQALCFNFVYPITLSYNNGTVIEVNSYDGLIALLEAETENFYLEGIQFPFQVQEEMTITTINNEDEFMALVQSCGFDTIDEEIYVFDCYDIVYPFSVINQDNETITIHNESELYSFFASPTSNSDDYIVDFVYPISLTANGQTYEVNNLYELFELFDECEGNTDCICPADYNPVCVNDGFGNTITYSNACHAACDGYTEADFVDCGTNNNCGCPENFDPVCVNDGLGGVRTFGNSCLAACAGYNEADFIDCGIVSPDNFGGLLGTCFQMSYPLQVEYQGALVTVNNDGELLQYYFPSESALPDFHYPVQVMDTPVSSITISSAMQFSQFISTHCN